MNPASPEPPRAHGRVVYMNAGGAHTHPPHPHYHWYLHLHEGETHSYQPTSHGLYKDTAFAPKPTQAYAGRSTHIRNEPKQAKMPRLNLVASGK